MASFTARVLIVDDVAENIHLLLDVLRLGGYQGIGAQSGPEALDIVRDVAPECILLDIHMPEMDGYSVCQQLKQDPELAHIPVIFISAMYETNDILHGFEAGGVDFISKPFNPKEVLARVTAQVTLARQRQELQEAHDQIAALRQKDQDSFSALNAMRDQFIYAATHDLKNPLFVIKTAIAMVRDSQGKPDALERYAGMIREGVDRMQQLISTMLELAQIQTGVSLHRRPQALMPILERVLKHLSLVAIQQEVTLGYALEDNPVVNGDAIRIEQIFDNLVGNAIKYTPAGGQVQVRLARNEQWAVISVADTGLGIPEDALPRLFEAFYRVKTKQHNAQAGTGLGLAIVKTLVEQHQGDISVSSQLGQGSIFTVRLPAIVQG